MRQLLFLLTLTIMLTNIVLSYGSAFIVQQHVWVELANVLVAKLYDPSLGLFRETWGTYEGQRWYWNTEQGEAAQILAQLGFEDLLAQVVQSYQRYLVYMHDGFVYPLTRYVSNGSAEIRSRNATSFYIRNLIVGIGGDLAAASDRFIKLYNDIYDPSIWHVANMRSWEVWYDGLYKGIWDVPERIISYGFYTNTSVACAYRVMSDNNLTYRVDICVPDNMPYVIFKLMVVNNSTYMLNDVMTTLAFDSLDWWQYKYLYIPGKGVIKANSTEQWPHVYGEGGWLSFNGQWHFILYTKRPIGMNRAVAVILPSPNVDLWVYNTRQWPDNDWYFMWFKIRIHWGNLAPGESKTFIAKIVPLSSFAPAALEIYDSMLANKDELAHRDPSFAVNTGTGVFKGFAMAGIILAALSTGYIEFVERLWSSVSKVFEAWNYSVATRPLSNFILASLVLYKATMNETYLEAAKRAAEALLKSQVKDPNDPRNGGFLDIPPPWGAGTYLDVNAEAAHALVELYRVTGNTTYIAAVNYWLENWFHYNETEKRWFYYRFADPSHPWYKGYLDEKEPYAQGYFLQAVADWLELGDTRVLTSLSRIFELLTDELWIKTWDGANETNVETQSSVAAGLKKYAERMLTLWGIAIEYVKGAKIVELNRTVHGVKTIITIKLHVLRNGRLIIYTTQTPKEITVAYVGKTERLAGVSGFIEIPLRGYGVTTITIVLAKFSGTYTSVIYGGAVLYASGPLDNGLIATLNAGANYTLSTALAEAALAFKEANITLYALSGNKLSIELRAGVLTIGGTSYTDVRYVNVWLANGVLTVYALTGKRWVTVHSQAFDELAAIAIYSGTAYLMKSLVVRIVAPGALAVLNGTDSLGNRVSLKVLDDGPLDMNKMDEVIEVLVLAAWPVRATISVKPPSAALSLGLGSSYTAYTVTFNANNVTPATTPTSKLFPLPLDFDKHANELGLVVAVLVALLFPRSLAPVAALTFISAVGLMTALGWFSVSPTVLGIAATLAIIGLALRKHT